MKNKEFQRRLVYDTLILLGVFTVILFMCRLWPLILLCILGLFAAMIRLLFLSRKETVIIQSVPQEPAKAETEKDLQQLARFHRQLDIIAEGYRAQSVSF